MRSALSGFDAEMDYNVGEAEFSRPEIVVIHQGREIKFSGIESEAWKRKESDGRLDPGSPMLIPSVVIPRSALRREGIEQDQYHSLVVVVGDERLGVISYEGGNPVRLFLKTDTSELPEHDYPELDDPPETDNPEPDPEPELPDFPDFP